MELDQDIDTLWLSTLLKKSIHNGKPVDVINVNVEAAVPKGENYTSNVYRVKIKALTCNGSPKTYSLIVKHAKTSAQMQAALQEFAAFKSESKMFSTILLQMEALMEEFGDKRDTLWPQMYGYKPYSSIVLEDLKDQNYSLIDRTGWQNLNQSMLVVRAAGRYHAMGKVLMERGLIGEDEKGHYFAGKNTSMKIKMFSGALTVFCNVIFNRKGLWTPAWDDIGEKIKKQIIPINDILENLYFNYDKNFEVLNHGDLWSSNMMFKSMEYTDIPVAVKFLDYQVPHLNSFIWDLTYFLYVAVKPSVRRAHKAELLKAYHQSFSDNLKFFKFSGYIPTLEDVMNESKRLLPAAFSFAMTVLPITSTTTKDAFDFEKLSGSPEEAFNEFIYTEEKFFNEVGEDLKEFSELNII